MTLEQIFLRLTEAADTKLPVPAKKEAPAVKVKVDLDGETAVIGEETPEVEINEDKGGEE